MSVQTRIYTNHSITVPGSSLKADMMLDDAGRGNITLATLEGQQVVTIDAARAESIMALLQECITARDIMTQTGDELITDSLNRPTTL